MPASSSLLTVRSGWCSSGREKPGAGWLSSGVGRASGLRSALTLIDGFDDGTVRMWLRELGEGYDFVLYDAKAASGALRRAVLGLADVMIVATRLEAWGLAEVVPLIEQYRGQGGDPARVVVLPVAVQRFTVHEYNLNLLKERLGERVWAPVPHRRCCPGRTGM